MHQRAQGTLHLAMLAQQRDVRHEHLALPEPGRLHHLDRIGLGPQFLRRHRHHGLAAALYPEQLAPAVQQTGQAQ